MTSLQRIEKALEEIEGTSPKYLSRDISWHMAYIDQKKLIAALRICVHAIEDEAIGLLHLPPVADALEGKGE